MNRLRVSVLTIWAIGLAVLLGAGRYSLFIRAQLWPLLLATLLMFVLLLLAMVARRGTAAPRASAAAWVRSALLLLPLAYMFPLMSRASSSGLNSFALQKRSLGMNTGPESSIGPGDAAYPVLDKNPPVPGGGETCGIDVVARHFRHLIGRHVVTDGRVYRDDALPDGQMALYRFVVVCCAADAMPVQVVVKASDLSGLRNDQWVRVEGAVGSAHQDGGEIPVIDATKVTTIPPPDEPYLSPYRY